MNFWEPGLTETLYTIALFLFVAILLAPLSGWSPDDDTQSTDTNAAGSEPQAVKGNEQ